MISEYLSKKSCVVDTNSASGIIDDNERVTFLLYPLIMAATGRFSMKKLI